MCYPTIRSVVLLQEPFRLLQKDNRWCFTKQLGWPGHGIIENPLKNRFFFKKKKNICIYQKNLPL